VLVTETRITCPECGFAKVEAMPTNACLLSLRRRQRASKAASWGLLRVFCSYADHVCPPKQAVA
jgi:hypothetical protein